MVTSSNKREGSKTDVQEGLWGIGFLTSLPTRGAGEPDNNPNKISGVGANGESFREYDDGLPSIIKRPRLFCVMEEKDVSNTCAIN